VASPRYSAGTWNLGFSQVLIDVGRTRRGTLRPILFVDAHLNDGDEEDPATGPDDVVVSLSEERLRLVRRIVELIDDGHRVRQRYPILSALQRRIGTADRKSLARAYAEYLRADLCGPSGSPYRAETQKDGAVVVNFRRAPVRAPEGLPRD